jgi:putative chitinase
MIHRTATQWLKVLEVCGADASWAQAFADFFSTVAFSKGDSEVIPFIANIIHESDGLRDLEENLSYSAKRMTEVWPSRFPTEASAKPFERNPQTLAGKVYGGRLGNLTAKHAWDYRGSGLIMITGLYNFQLVEKVIGVPIVSQPDLLRKPTVASLKAAWAWWEKKVPDSVIGDTRLTRKAVNGGDIGLKHVQDLTSKLQKVL